MKKIMILLLTLALALTVASCGEPSDAFLTAGDGENGGGYADSGIGDTDETGIDPSDTNPSDTDPSDADQSDWDGGIPNNDRDTDADNTSEGEKVNDLAVPDDGESNDESWKPEYDEYYYDVENVVLYLEAYDELPPNYITKEEANDLGWNGGSVEDYMDGAAIGGDRFGNYEGLLPKADGRVYTECDIDTDGYDSRGARRLVFSNDGLYFYTDDHYETFTEVTVEEGEVSY